jgi:hypothetical protein
MIDKLREIPTIIFRIILALLFSGIFIFSPGSQSVLEKNPDVENYLRRIDNILHNRDTIVDDEDLLEYLSHEPIWGHIQELIGEFFYDPIDGLQLISFFSIFIYSFFLFRRINLLLASTFLFNPMVVDLVMAQVRSAFAVALLLIALMIKNRLFGLIMLIMVSMIHSVVFIIFIVYTLANYLESNENRFSHKQLGLAALFFAIIISVVFGAGREEVLGAVGDRRADIEESTSSISYLSYWMLLAVVMPFIPRHNNKFKEYWIEYYSIIMLALPFLMAIFGANGARFIPLSFPIFLYSLSIYTTQTKKLLITSLFIYQLIQYFYWVKKIF